MVHDKFCQREGQESDDIMRVVLINPPLVADRSLINEGGIPYMPILLASINGVLRNLKFDVRVFDMFGLAPQLARINGDNIVYGMNWDGIRAVIKEDDVIIIFVTQAICLGVIKDIIKGAKEAKAKRIILAENSQHVLGIALDLYKDELFSYGVDYILCGDPEADLVAAVNGFSKDRCSRKYTNIDLLPAPDWTGFPLQNYWKLSYAHAPKIEKKYISLLTSRGCPNACRFCTSPYLNKSKWRGRSVQKVFEEIRGWCHRAVREFHIEDLNPTVDKKRFKELCQLIIDSGLLVKIKIASGTKMETLDEDLLLWMHDAGVDYLSFSPESGSKALLQFMGKKFDHAYALKMLDFINSFRFTNPMITQACFVLGYPHETELDIDLTRKYIKELAIHGLDEIALFSYVPLPGAAETRAQIDPTKASFSSKWKGNYSYMNSLKMQMTLEFYLYQFMYRPFRIFRFFRTKVWMTIKRLLIMRWLNG